MPDENEDLYFKRRAARFNRLPIFSESAGTIFDTLPPPVAAGASLIYMPAVDDGSAPYLVCSRCQTETDDLAEETVAALYRHAEAVEGGRRDIFNKQDPPPLFDVVVKCDFCEVTEEYNYLYNNIINI